jgi:glycosyltransferase involved in cell wall biosynthesis
MRLLVVAMPESVHTARWLAQLGQTGWSIDLFSSRPSGTANPGLRGVTAHGPFWSRNRSRARLRGLPVCQTDLAYVADRALERLRPDRRRDALVRLVRRLRPDVVHSLEFQSGAYLTLRAREVIGDAFPPWLATNWGSDIAHFRQFPEHVEPIRRVLASADAYSCECARDARLARELGFRGVCFSPSPNAGGYDLEAAAPLRASPPSRRPLVMVKGYQHFVGRALVALKAVEACADVLSGHRICVYSATPDVAAEARDLARRTGLPVEILRADASVPHDEILARHGAARVSLALSMSDGISTSFLEALLMGSFPLQSWTSCANEWITDGETGMLLPPDDADETASALRRALTDDQLVDAAAAANWRTAQERLDARELTRKAVDMYTQVARLRPR